MPKPGIFYWSLFQNQPNFERGSANMDKQRAFPRHQRAFISPEDVKMATGGKFRFLG
jgi:hypothetical protein